MATIGATAPVLDARQVAARLERLPFTSWHNKMRVIIGTAWFFDAFDSLTIAFVLPPLIGMWHLQPGQIGSLIGIGFIGQIIGSIGAGWLAEKIGRVKTLMITLLIFTVMAFACAQATDYETMWWFRLIQGIGLGGEVPIMAAYVGEYAKAERRGRFSLGIQFMFTVGLVGVGAVSLYVVRAWGWQSMFYIGAIPALLALPMRTWLPESPRWLASRGRFAEADESLGRIERIAVAEGKPLPALPQDLPPVDERPVRIGDLFKGIYLKRTMVLWVVWVCTYIITYGLTAWAPSLFRFVYKLPDQQAITYGFILQSFAFLGALSAIFLIDRLGRKYFFGSFLLIASLPLFVFALDPAVVRDPETVLKLICLSFVFVSVLSLGMATYTAENYPNHIRGLGSGVAAAWQRVASWVGPFMVGWMLDPKGMAWGLGAVFVTFAVVAVIGGLTMLLFANETKGQVLEKLSPPT